MCCAACRDYYDQTMTDINKPDQLSPRARFPAVNSLPIMHSDYACVELMLNWSMILLQFMLMTKFVAPFCSRD